MRDTSRASGFAKLLKVLIHDRTVEPRTEIAPMAPATQYQALLGRSSEESISGRGGAGAAVYCWPAELW
jgi:hypothetical protein